MLVELGAHNVKEYQTIFLLCETFTLICIQVKLTNQSSSICWSTHFHRVIPTCNNNVLHSDMIPPLDTKLIILWFNCLVVAIFSLPCLPNLFLTGSSSCLAGTQSVLICFPIYLFNTGHSVHLFLPHYTKRFLLNGYLRWLAATYFQHWHW